jgi:hypothetical protein
MSQLHFPDEIPVSEEEVQAWLDTVPNLSAAQSDEKPIARLTTLKQKSAQKSAK